MACSLDILISGYFGHGNTGDEVVLSGIRAGIAVTAGGRTFRIRVLSGTPEYTARTHRLRAYRQFSPLGIVRALAWSDCLVLGGGSLIQDVTSRRSALYYLWLARTAQASGRPVFVWAQGFGPLRHPGLRRLAAKVLSRAQGITVRDAQSLEDVRALGVEAAVLSADPAFLAPRAGCLADNVLPRPREGEGFLGIAVRDWPQMDAGLAPLAAACGRFARETPLFPLYIPFQHARDADVSRRMAEATGQPSEVMQALLSPDEMVTLFYDLHQVLGMRLHSLILAARAHVPFAGISYDPKVEAFCRMAGMPCIAMNDVDTSPVAGILADLRSRRAEVGDALRRFATQQEQSALVSADLFWERVSL